MVAANLLRKTATELVEMGLSTKDVPKGIAIDSGTGRFRIMTKIPERFLTNKLKQNKKFQKKASAIVEYFPKETTLDKAVSAFNKNNKLVLHFVFYP